MMFTIIRSLMSRLKKQSTGINKAVRAEVIRKLNDIYNLIDNHGDAHLNADSLNAIGIICEQLILSSDGSYLDSNHPVFFQPLPLASLPGPHPNDTRTQRELAVWTRCFDGEPRREETPSESAQFLSAAMQWYFTKFRRDVPNSKRSRPSLMGITRWFPVEFSPYIFNNKFTGMIYYSWMWAPGDAWTTESGLSHAMFTLIISGEPDERLLRAEALAITAALITRLNNPVYKRQCVVPVMVFSLLGHRKARILQAYNNSEGLVIRKSKIFSFSSIEEAERNVDLFMQFMANEPVGDTFHLHAALRPHPPPVGIESSGNATSNEGSTIPRTRPSLSHLNNIEYGRLVRSISNRAQSVFSGHSAHQTATCNEPPQIPPFAFEASSEASNLGWDSLTVVKDIKKSKVFDCKEPSGDSIGLLRA